MFKTVAEILEQDNSYAQYLADRLVIALVKSTNRSSKFAYQLCAGFEQNFEHVMNDAGINFPQKDKGKMSHAYPASLSSGVVDPKDWKAIEDFIAVLEDGSAPDENIFSQNARKLKEHLGLSDVETDSLIYIHAINEMNPEYRNFVGDLLRGTPERLPAFIALAMGRGKQLNTVHKAVSLYGGLVSSGLITYVDQNMNDIPVPEIDEDLQKALSEAEFDFEEVTETLIGKPVKAELTIDRNFPHMRKKAEQIAVVLNSAIKRKLAGLNVVLYGPSGSGKTALAEALAEKIGVPAYLIGEDEDSNKFMSPMKRLIRLRQAQTILREGLTITDEIEDFLIKGGDTSKAADTGSKILLNRTLENNTIPGILICNDIAKFHTSVRQRFKLVSFVGYQPTLVRQDIWSFHIEKNGLSSIKEDDIRALARRYEAPPRVIAHACEIAALSDGGIAILREQVEAQAALEYNGDRSGYDVDVPVPGDYDLDLLETESDLKAVVQAFKTACEKGAPACFLIDGERNVGKSTLASYLAEQSMRHTTFFDMDHLLRPTAQSEPVDNISIAFNHAVKSDAILVIEDLNLLFGFAAKGDKEKIVKRFMKHLGDHNAPVIVTNEGATKNIPDSFSAFMDHRVSLRAIEGEKLQKAAQKLLGRPLDDATPTAIGHLSFAARSLTGNINPDDTTIHKRIAASAHLSSPNISGGFGG